MKWILSKTSDKGKTLLVLSVVLIFVFFSPTLRWAGEAISRVNPVRAGRVEATIPRTWLVSQGSTGRLQAWKPCITILCSTASANLVIEVYDKLPLDEGTWSRGAERGLVDLGFSNVTAREIGGVSGRTLCLEATREGTQRETVSTCANFSTGITATLSNARGGLERLYEIVATARPVPKAD